MTIQTHKKPTARELVNAAKRAGWRIRTKGGHTIIYKPNGGIITLRAPGRPNQSQQLDQQTKDAREAGLPV